MQGYLSRDLQGTYTGRRSISAATGDGTVVVWGSLDDKDAELREVLDSLGTDLSDANDINACNELGL